MSNEKVYSSLRIRSPLLKIINYLVLILGILLIILPMLIIFNISFKSNEEYLYTGFLQLPKSFLNLQNFATVFNKAKFDIGGKNTLILILVPLFGMITMGTMVSYVFSRFDFMFKKFLLGAYVAASLIPQTVTAVSTFTIIKNIHLYNTIFAGIILYLSASVLEIYIYIQFIEKIPNDLDESGLIDGASYFRIYRSIILPQMKPAIATTAILKIAGIYNDMFTPFLYMPKTSLSTVTTSLMRFTYDNNTQWNLMAAGIVTVLLPTFLMYLFLQRYIIAGVSEGAVKS